MMPRSLRLRDSTRGADALLSVLVVAIVGMMVVPLPTALLDLLISLNLTLGVLLLSAALYVREPLSFAAFPTLLLLSTLYRLALNVSSTRLILLQADAGRVIEAFGSFVVRGDYLVGAMVFAILTLIQFIVIARGAERVAEVGARFSLDAMPGKQLAIDAELRAGNLSAEAARSLRKRLERESQLYGALDGAMKFVKGDAIAGVIITLVNFCAGAAIGTLSRGLALTESLETYALLTIGDGLVSQIPSLLVSTSAGLVVTRVASRDGRSSLGSEVSSQLLRDERALGTAVAFLAVLALVPGLPFVPFAALAALAGVGLVQLRRKKGERPAEAEGEARTEARANVKFAPPLSIELGETLDAWLADGGSAATSRASIAEAIGRGIVARHGFEVDEIEVRADGALAPREVVVKVKGVSLGRASVESPVEARERAVGLALEVVAQNVAELLGLEECQRLCDALEKTRPALVRNVVPKPVPLALLADVARRLAEEGLSLAHLPAILDALAIHAPNERDPLELAELCRLELRHPLVGPHLRDGALEAHLVDPEIEEAVRESIRRTNTGAYLAMRPEDASAIVEATRKAGARILLTQGDVRRFVRMLLSPELPEIVVFSYAELPPRLRVEPLGRIAIGATGEAAA